MGKFPPHLRSANQGLRQWKTSIPSRNARQVGGEMGFWVAVLGTRWTFVAASDAGAHVFDPALAATAFEVGGLGLDDTTLKLQEITSDEGSYGGNSMESNLWLNNQAVLSWLEPSIARSEALLSVFFLVEGKCWGEQNVGKFLEEMRQMRIWKNGFILIEFGWYLLIYVEGILPDVLRWREKGTDLRHKARGKPCGNPHLEHWMQHESTHVTESWRVWSQGSVMLFVRVEFNIYFQDPRKTGIKAKLDKHVRQRTILRVQNWIYSINTP